MNKNKKIFKGLVIAKKNPKTVKVVIESYIKHPLYKKKIQKTKKFNIHDPLEKAQVGNIISFIESRPFSKTKHHLLLEILSSSSIKKGKLKI